MEVKIKIKSRRKLLLLVLFLIFLLMMGIRCSSCCTGKGGIEKGCYHEEGMPIGGAEVYIVELEQSEFTDVLGWAYFPDIYTGTYTIWCDIDNDGVWDGEPDTVVVVDGEVTSLINWFPLPKVQGLEASNFKSKVKGG